MLAVLQTQHICLHLRSGHHLHRLGDLANVVHSLHSLLEGLFGGAEVAGGHGDEELGGGEQVPLEEGVRAHALELSLHHS